MAVAYTNLNADSTRDEGIVYNNILSKIILTDEDESVLISEEITDTTNIGSYLKDGVKSETITEDKTSLANKNLANITSSGALIKPTIISETVLDNISDNDVKTYIVKTGDTVSSIAQKFDLIPETILWSNKLAATSTIKPGQQLYIPPVDGLLHKVKKGDTLQDVADFYEADIQDIVNFNHLAGADDIKIGEVLVIPYGQMPQINDTIKTVKPKTLYTQIKNILKPTTKAITKIPSALKIPSSLKGRFIWPTSVKTVTQYAHLGHVALDIASRASPPIYASASGQVTRAAGSGYNGGYGHVVDIDHGNGYSTRYGHMTTVFVKPGQYVKQGQVIGIMGSTGRSTGPHLHFEIIAGKKKLNPLSLVTR